MKDQLHSPSQRAVCRNEERMMCHLQVGALNRVAIVLSCPGRHEMNEGRPAAKATGANLETLLEQLRQQMRRADITRPNITITNSWPNVEYPALTGRSEPSPTDIVQPENIQRLNRELAAVTEFVIFCGNRAKAISKALTLPQNPKFIYLSHLGLQGINATIKTDIDGGPIKSADVQIAAGGKLNRKIIESENTRKRFAVIAAQVLAQLRSSSA